MKAWLKCGIISMIVSIFSPLLLVLIVLGLYFDSIFGKIFNCSYSPTVWFTPGSYDCTGNSLAKFLTIFVPISLFLIIFFLIGALIGWIVEKVKARKAEN
jgi:hypothetical protein